MQFFFMKISHFLPFILILGLLSYNGCTDDPPNAVGSDVLPVNDGFNILSYDTTASSSSTYLNRIGGVSTVMMLGKYQDNEARSLLSFTIDSTLYPKSRIDSATLNFRITYKYKDSLGTIGFEIHNMRTDFTPGTYTWDSLTTSSYSDTVLGTYTAAIQPGDTILSVRLDTGAVRSWVNNKKSSLILLPTNASTMILGLATVNSNESYQPKLSIAYHDSVDSTHVDSIFTMQRVSITNCALPSVTQHVFVQGSIAERGLMKFDVSGIPKNASVTQATLQLSLDTTISVLGYSSDSSVIAEIALDDSAKPTEGGLYGKGTFQNSHTVTFSIASVVQQWVTNRVNHGLVLRVLSEYVKFDRYSFYDATAPSSLKPKLSIKYSVVR
jgi:hypothetical protein